MFKDFGLLLIVIAISTGSSIIASGTEPASELAAEAAAFFEAEIRPLLVDRCYECHGELTRAKGGLKLTSRAELLVGGATGPAAVPGKPAESLLVAAVRHQGPKMPPKTRLSDVEIEKLVRWIDQGLPWPNSKPAAASSEVAFKISNEQRHFWSFQPVHAQSPPAVNDLAWSRTPIDHFILARLESRGLHPNPAADKRTLLRRATFDLIGLPPTPVEIDAFLADDCPDAFARVIERLLASPHYGERWGRHWLDVVRYADTAGETADYPVPQAYRYRNYAIDAFNRDKPYDEFVREQIAGDILAVGGPRELHAERVTATGYLAISRRFGFDSENYHHLTIADTLDTVGRSILGLSIGCARCHDHKYDPISMADYYALYGIFASSRYAFPGSEEKNGRAILFRCSPNRKPRPLAAAHQEQLARCDAELKRLDGELVEVKKSLRSAEEAGPTGAADLAGLKTNLDRVSAAAEEWRSKKERLQLAGPCEMAYGVSEAAGQNAKIQKRGEPTKTGAEVPRRFLEILDGDVLPAGIGGSGRLQLAAWLTRPGNPLTARVIVNRVWQYHFGRGLVLSASDFGLRGRIPTHPQLLDYLADSLMMHGWSLKTLHRQIMLSSVYQMSSDDDNPASAVEPANETWWKCERRRMDAEAIRDAVLAVSGQLDSTPGAAHPFPPVTSWNFTQHAPFKANYETDRRSVYLMTQRIQRHPFLGKAIPGRGRSQRKHGRKDADDHALAGVVLDE